MGILLGPTDNIQGIQIIIDTKTGMIKNFRTICNLPMPQAVINSVQDWEKRSSREEHWHKMVFWDWNKERHNCDIIDIDKDARTAEVNPSPLNKIPAELPEIDLETDNIYTSVVTLEIGKSDGERIHDATTNSLLIPEENNRQSEGVATLVDETPIGGGDPIDVPQECVSHKTEVLNHSKIEVEDVSNEDSNNNILVTPQYWNIFKADPSRWSDGTRHESHAEKGFGEPPGKTSVTKYLLNNKRENVNDKIFS